MDYIIVQLHSLIEKSIAGYKEIEYEVMRDKMIMPLLFVTWKISIQLVYIQGIPLS